MQHAHPIIIADGNEALLEGLSNIVGQEPAFRVVGTARNAGELIEKVLICSPELLLVDFDLPQLNGLQVTKHVLNSKKKPAIIILTNHWENSLIMRIKAAGVMGCLRKTCDTNELIFAIGRVLEGKTYFSRAVGIF